MRISRTNSGRLLTIVCLALLIPLSSLFVSSAFGQAAAEDGARIFPKSTNVFLRVGQPDELVEKILNHPLRETIESLPQVQAALKSQEFKQGKIGLAYMEARIGEKWLPALKKLTDHGLFVGAEFQSQSVGVAFHSSDEALLKKTAGEILGFIKGQAGEDAVKIRDYRSGKFADIENVIIARFGEWFIVSNNSDYAKKMADNLLDGVVAGKELSNTLVKNPVFAQAWKTVKDASDLWAFADLDIIRKSGNADQLFAGSTDNAATELLFGGILEAFEDANHIAASLALSDESLALKTNLPFDATSFKEPREFYFGSKSMGRAPVDLNVPGMIGQISTYRDLGRWWLAKEDLFPEKVIAQLALADSQLSTFFGGADFGEEILGALQPGLQIVTKEQTYPEGVDPDIKLPAFALVGRLQNPDREKRFRISFNSFVTLLNLSEENEMPQFDVQTMNEGDYRITSASYLLEDMASDGLLYTNFSPSIAFQDDYMIISSTEEFAHELARTTMEPNVGKVSDSNTRLTLDASAIKSILQLNRKSLIAQQMVEGGKTREQASGEIDFALSLLDAAKSASADYRVEPKQMVLDLQIDFQN